MSYAVMKRDYMIGAHHIGEFVYSVVTPTATEPKIRSTWIMKSDAEDEARKMNQIDIAMETTWEDESGRIFK